MRLVTGAVEGQSAALCSGDLLDPVSAGPVPVWSVLSPLRLIT